MSACSGVRNLAVQTNLPCLKLAYLETVAKALLQTEVVAMVPMQKADHCCHLNMQHSLDESMRAGSSVERTAQLIHHAIHRDFSVHTGSSQHCKSGALKTGKYDQGLGCSMAVDLVSAELVYGTWESRNQGVGMMVGRLCRRCDGVVVVRDGAWVGSLV